MPAPRLGHLGRGLGRVVVVDEVAGVVAHQRLDDGAGATDASAAIDRVIESVVVEGEGEGAADVGVVEEVGRHTGPIQQAAADVVARPAGGDVEVEEKVGHGRGGRNARHLDQRAVGVAQCWRTAAEHILQQNGVIERGPLTGEDRSHIDVAIL